MFKLVTVGAISFMLSTSTTDFEEEVKNQGRQEEFVPISLCLVICIPTSVARIRNTFRVLKVRHLPGSHRKQSTMQQTK
jgi:hypothetical protein